MRINDPDSKLLPEKVDALTNLKNFARGLDFFQAALVCGGVLYMLIKKNTDGILNKGLFY